MVNSGEALALHIMNMRKFLSLNASDLAPYALQGYALFFDKKISKEESANFFGKLVPALCRLLLQLPSMLEKQYQKANHVLAGVKSKLRLLGPQEAGFVLLSQVHTSGAIEDQPSEALEVDFEDEYFGGLTPSYDTLEHVTGTSDSANQVVESSQGWCIKHEEKKIGIATGN
ncbi:hypothetical protein AXX17_AT4G04870 [Arabidopsis thaliana]|uniref:PARG helical domain-containing protein n=1 Tax=Arabidopsis thaliana TaxID=3702 RepID=A0A178UZL3_ARATH|nr:hypothetical protein AXX17_AT4G04870 [Arabidopsis thaliana]